MWTRIIGVVDDQGIVIRCTAWATGFSVLQSIQISPVAHPAFYSMDVGSTYPEVE
jgi:hypothetical protein